MFGIGDLDVGAEDGGGEVGVEERGGGGGAGGVGVGVGVRWGGERRWEVDW